MATEDEKIGCVLGIVGCLLIVPNSLWSGFVISKLWAWFIVPTFAVPPLSIIAAIGVFLVVSAFHPSKFKKAKKDDEQIQTFIEATVFNLLWPAIFLGVGAFWKMFL